VEDRPPTEPLTGDGPTAIPNERNVQLELNHAPGPNSTNMAGKVNSNGTPTGDYLTRGIAARNHLPYLDDSRTRDLNETEHIELQTLSNGSNVTSEPMTDDEPRMIADDESSEILPDQTPRSQVNKLCTEPCSIMTNDQHLMNRASASPTMYDNEQYATVLDIDTT